MTHRRVPEKPSLVPVEILFKPDPVYTEAARKLGLQGEIVLSVIFTASGRLQVVRVVEGLGYGLDEAACRAAEAIRFKPARRDGKRWIFQLLCAWSFNWRGHLAFQGNFHDEFQDFLSVGLLAGLFLFPGEGQGGAEKPREAQQGESPAVRVVVDRIMAREKALAQTLQKYRPRVETYLQEVRPGPDGGVVPHNDQYFLGQLEFDKGVEVRSFLPKSRIGLLSRMFGNPGRLFKSKIEIDSFAQASLVDYKGLDRKHYQFQFVRSTFLGDLRCLLFDVSPRRHAGPGGSRAGSGWKTSITPSSGSRASGTKPPKFYFYIHFDSWRQNLQPGLWLPVFVYAEDPAPSRSDRKHVSGDTT